MAEPQLMNVPVRILESFSRYVQGREEMIRLLVVTVLAGGHALIEGPPGTAKTVIARLFTQAIGGKFSRIQLTPDMLPGDITGYQMYRPDGNSRFVPGPIFGNTVLADELNRTSPRTQSAFLEAMEEHQVTVEGTTHELPEPFFLIATQVPEGGDGTFQLTEAQADRFMLRLMSEYPERDAELRIVGAADLLESPQIEPVTNLDAILKLRQLQKSVHVSDLVQGYIVDLVAYIRRNDDILSGPSPRAPLSLFRCSRALAFTEGKEFVLPDDVRRLAHPALDHRIRLTLEAEIDGETPRGVVDAALEAVPVPKGAT